MLEKTFHEEGYEATEKGLEGILSKLKQARPKISWPRSARAC